MVNEILIVVVVYEENIYNTNVYHSLLKYVSIPVYIYDNSKICLIDKVPCNNWTYVFNGKNEGISKAYNCASIYAKKNNFHWMLFCDHDTTFPENFLLKMTYCISKFPQIKLFAPNIRLDNGRYLSPQRQVFGLTKMSTKMKSGILKIKKYNIINSGLIVAVDEFIKCGGYNDKVWLDYSDLQFIDRFSRIEKFFYAIEISAIQNFSARETDPNKLLNRFTKFCGSVSNYETFTFGGKIKILFLVLKRTMSLTFKTCQFKFIKIFVNDYLFR